MFSADLSWMDDTVEKVGQRKGRKHRAREKSVSSSLSKSSDDTQKGQLPTLVRPSFASVKGSLRKPPGTSSSISSTERRKRTPLPTPPPEALKDPLQQPNWTLTAKLPSKLPSGGPLESPPPFTEKEVVPSPNIRPTGRILYSRQTNLTREAAPGVIDDAAHRAWSVSNPSEADRICHSYERVQLEILALRSKPDVLVKETHLHLVPELADYTPTPSELEAQENQIAALTPPEKNPRRYGDLNAGFGKDGFLLPPTPTAEPVLELPSLFSALSVRGSDNFGPPPPRKDISRSTTPINHLSHWQAPGSWDLASGTKSPSTTKRTASVSQETSNTSTGEDRRQNDTSHFQRFVRRMEGAGPRIILERLKEEWDDPADFAMSQELHLEKHLWALTALHIKALERFVRPSDAPAPSAPLPPLCLNRRRKILELDGNLGEVYQLSAIYPHSKIAHLTSTPPNLSSSIPLPSQAIHHALRASSQGSSSTISSGAGLLPLPYASSSMHHVRSSRIASLLPASQLPQLLSECHRVLKPGGVLELRLMDAIPERGSMGPRLATWLEERLLLGLEREFRCQRPIMMVPRWAAEAGFQPLPFRNEFEAQDRTSPRSSLDKMGVARSLRLPAATPEREQGSRDVVAQVGVLVGRALWKDAWGSFVHEDDEENWWWDNPDVIDECREWKTVWDVGTLYVVKEEEEGA
ncbi:hypothetical protein EG328_000522 [Venturia inaequalis]|uniref:Methyltransferase type 11 domain-containing protein n=1 Tax=Venturia inaequalis TaxID=5025 RepID=A0A8H3UBW9_VENIN|nr:hypothetical protein EG328_000522 [Venturia inaequalis]KAE9967289.1 hypothetical protein EG327_011553 [Venturia inaequalis]RDI87788.1 hypothetical protein Vi05172_g2602 [Venturia inaequalis]